MAINNNPLRSTVPSSTSAPAQPKEAPRDAAANVNQVVTATTKAASALKDTKVADALDALGSKSLAGQIREGLVNKIATKTAAVTGLGSVAANASTDALSALNDTKTVVGAADAMTGTQGVGKALGRGAAGLGAAASAASLKGAVEKTINGEAGFAEAKTVLTASRDLSTAATAAGKAIAKYGDDGVKVAKAAVNVGKSVAGAATKVAAKTGAKTALKSAGRFMPGMNVAIAAVDTGIAAADIKKAVNNPTPKNIAKAALGSVTAAGSIVAASNIPGASQLGAGVAVVADVAKAAVDVDWGAVKNDATQVASKAYDQGTKMLSNAWSKATSWW